MREEAVGVARVGPQRVVDHARDDGGERELGGAEVAEVVGVLEHRDGAPDGGADAADGGGDAGFVFGRGPSCEKVQAAPVYVAPSLRAAWAASPRYASFTIWVALTSRATPASRPRWRGCMTT